MSWKRFSNTRLSNTSSRTRFLSWWQRSALLVIVAGAATFSLGWYIGSDSVYFRINRSIETFGEVFRRASTDYVDEIDPDEFVRYGVDAMMSHLDPYSVYMDQEQSEDFDSQVSGQYVGLGIQTATRDSMLTVTNVTEGYSAWLAGMRIGDRIVSIDGHPTLYLPSKELRKFTRGEDSSVAEVRVLRDGQSDTLTFNVLRRRVMVPSVPYIHREDNGVIVLKLTRFTRRSALEMRNAIDSMRSLGPLNGIVLDLRDNPGGLLDAAINIGELFVRNGATIVSTKGRNSAEARIFTSSTIPYEGQAPIAVLVNGSSASASEVLAGCLQDQDRGVICGTQSFGKGLVQSQYSISYGTNLKLTTQRYYCPSGRCVQRIDYSKKRAGVVDTSSAPQTFYTMNKRPVKDGTGISPDSLMKDPEESEFVLELLKRDVLFRFANEYAGTHKELPSPFVASSLIDDLERFASKMKFNYRSTALAKVEEVQSMLSAQKFSSTVTKQLEEAETLIRREQQKMFRQHAARLAQLLDREIRSRYLSDRQMLQYVMDNDELVHKASALVLSDSYRTLLRQPFATK